jgi:hypothetical protein
MVARNIACKPPSSVSRFHSLDNTNQFDLDMDTFINMQSAKFVNQILLIVAFESLLVNGIKRFTVLKHLSKACC